MPLQRVSKGFKDISMSFQLNPLTKDAIVIKDRTAIARSIRNLVLTERGERFFNQNLGTRVNRLLFENLDNITASAVRDEIINVIKEYEPRVELKQDKVRVTPNYDTGELDIELQYDIVGIEIPTQQLSFVLEPVR